MLVLLTILFFILMIMCFIRWDDGDVAGFMLITFIAFLAITLITSIGVVSGRNLDSKISMYTEENQNIETQMNTLVEQYMNYESGTYGKLKGESSIALISLYPELKADVLVTKQIEVYIANNEKIKELKEAKIDLSAKKWWLYFGK